MNFVYTSSDQLVVQFDLQLVEVSWNYDRTDTTAPSANFKGDWRASLDMHCM